MMQRNRLLHKNACHFEEDEICLALAVGSSRSFNESLQTFALPFVFHERLIKKTKEEKCSKYQQKNSEQTMMLRGNIEY